jgi:Spy/CpxP family protein refolding chaperone
MKLHTRKLWLAAVTMAICVVYSGIPAPAQNAPAGAAAVKKAPAKPRGRLPAYYGQVVTPDQRAKIYSLQSPVFEKIEALQAQIKELQTKLDEEVKAVLTAEQLKKVEELTAAAKARSKAAPTENAAAAAPAQPAAPAAPKK